MQELGQILHFTWAPNQLTILTEGATVTFTVLALDLVRVQLIPTGEVPPTSWAVVKHDWAPAPATFEEQPGQLVLTTAQTVITITKNPVRMRVADSQDRTIVLDAQGLSFGDGRVAWRQASPTGTHYYGFGQKMGALDRQGRAMTLWTTDEPLHTPTTDQLYQAIPFYLGLKGGKAYGLFVDTTAKVDYDMNQTGNAIASVTTQSAGLDAYLFTNPDPKAVVSRYAELTGRMELPPRWALGYQQCRWSYYPESRVRAIADELRTRHIPADVIYLDIDYMDGYRVFTWDESRFPDPARLMTDLQAQGFKVVTIVDPGVKVDDQYETYTEGVAQNHFVHHDFGELFIGNVWPGSTAFPDFTRAGARHWWGEQHAQALLNLGVAGIWNDMNEPSCFAGNTFAETTVQGEDGHQVPHKYVHNAYGFLMSRATSEGLKRLQPEKRPFVLTRSGYAGIQRYAAVWMGDNHSWWEHLQVAMPMCMSMGLSGVPFVGTDIGGFQGDTTPELLARWTQMGAFTPFCRNHTAIGTRDQEPWAFGPQIEAICREYIELRYRMLPYLYNAFESASRTGLPIMRPLLLEYPADENTYNLSDQFLVGEELLICPVTQPGATKRMVYLPLGTWTDFWTGQVLGGMTYLVADAPLERMPIYVRNGAILPMAPVVQHTGETVRELILTVYAIEADGGTLSLYEDDGESMAYQTGQSARTTASFAADATSLTLTVSDPEGGFNPARESVTVQIHTGLAITQVLLNGALLAGARIGAGLVTATIPTPSARGFTLSLHASL